MQCPNCSFENPEGSKFCNECGKALGIDQQEDRFSLLHEYLPSELRKKILSAGKQIESERRLVTILFADISGFTALSEKLDPEIVSNILNDCFKGLTSIIHKYEGMIDKFIGDEVMVIFGAPIAHENDPERAVRCSLEMTEYMERFNIISPVKLPSPLGIHIGLNSGLVIAGNVGSDLRMDYSVIGDTVNLAARLVGIASTGKILLSQNTYKMVSDLTKVDGPTPTKVKGKKKPVEVYELLSLKKKTEVIFSKGVGELVGRKKEKEILGQALDLVLKKKEKRLFIKGEAGIGKTRLKEDLIQKADSKGISIYEGQCSSFDISTPYYLWDSLLRSILHLSSETTEAETRKLLHDALKILHFETDEPYLATLLSLRYKEILFEEDKERKRKIFEAVVNLLRAYAKKSPTLFIFEDLHWIDRFSQELMEYVFSQEKLARALFVAIFRTEYLDADKIKTKVDLIDLNKLSVDESTDLIKLRVNANDVPESMVSIIHERSEGNPFFIEEIIKTLQEKKLISVKRGKVKVLSENIEAGVPETIHGVIMARIDRLEEKIREVLLRASVIGREFSRPVLEHVANNSEEVLPGLRHLNSLELILEKDEADELEYLFKHYLIQEVAYDTILIKKRKEFHKLIAIAIEALYSDRLKDFYELLSFHYEKAEEWAKAAEYLNRTGRKVREIYTDAESREFFSRKEIALEKLYESKGVRRVGWNIFGIITAVISAIFIFSLAYGFIKIVESYLQVPLLSRQINQSEELKFHASLAEIVVVFLFAVLIIWFVIYVIFFWIIPFIRSRPQLFDLYEDELQIRMGRGKSISIPFTDIASMKYMDNERGASRPLKYRILDPWQLIGEYGEMGILSWWKAAFINWPLNSIVLKLISLSLLVISMIMLFGFIDVNNHPNTTIRLRPHLETLGSFYLLIFTSWLTWILSGPFPYPMGFGATSGEIYIKRKSGYHRMRVITPWMNAPAKSRLIFISPQDSGDYFEQLEVAYSKWLKTYNKRSM